MKIWRHYLYEAKFEVFANHKSLRYLFDQKELTLRQRRWVEFLKDCDFKVKHHPRKENVVVDVFSRKSFHSSSLMVKKWELLEKFKYLNLSIIVEPDRLSLNKLRTMNDLRNQMIEA